MSLLNLAHRWTDSNNGILLQVWSTCVSFAMFVEPGDVVVKELMLPFDLKL